MGHDGAYSGPGRFVGQWNQDRLAGPRHSGRREGAIIRFLEFFAANIRNANTRRAYARAVAHFPAWCEGRGVASVTGVQPLHVGAIHDWSEPGGKTADETGPISRAEAARVGIPIAQIEVEVLVQVIGEAQIPYRIARIAATHGAIEGII